MRTARRTALKPAAPEDRALGKALQAQIERVDRRVPGAEYVYAAERVRGTRGRRHLSACTIRLDGDPILGVEKQQCSITEGPCEGVLSFGAGCNEVHQRRGVDAVVEGRPPDDVTHEPGKLGQDALVVLLCSAMETLARRVDLEVAVKQERQARRDLRREEQMER